MTSIEPSPKRRNAAHARDTTAQTTHRIECRPACEGIGCRCTCHDQEAA